MHLVSVHAHLFWVFLGLSLAAPSAWAHDESAREAPPRSAPPPAATVVLRFDPPTLDLGDMIAGVPKSAPLVVTNIGTVPVTVDSMKGGCGCTTLSAHPTDPIAPGASFRIEVTVDPGMRTGVTLRKPVYAVLADGRAATMHVVGRVKTVIAVTPEEVDAIGPTAGMTAHIALESVDREPFALTGSTPDGLVKSQRPAGTARRFELDLDLEAWERAGRPLTVVFSTDRIDAPRLAVPIRFADAVAMFRLPPSDPSIVSRASRQDALLHEIDKRIAVSQRSPQFRMRLHRESGMLFVHGTVADLESARTAVRALPASSGVRESTPVPRE